MQAFDAGASRTKKDGLHLGRTVGAECDLAGAEGLVSIPDDQQRLVAGIASLMKRHGSRDARIGHGPGGDLYVVQLQIVRQLLFPETDGVDGMRRLRRPFSVSSSGRRNRRLSFPTVAQ